MGFSINGDLKTAISKFQDKIIPATVHFGNSHLASVWLDNVKKISDLQLDYTKDFGLWQ